ncbi:MAG: hypothetical protein GTO41_20690, partial [Burkholderiales bacterium]|nr:hypothetical protein [Burkholderiales bacterium]
MKRAAIAVSLMLACKFVFADEALEKRIDALQRELEALKSEVKNATTENVQDDLMPFESAAAKPNEGRASVGGYGEINYNNFKDSSKRDEFDLQRFILFLGYRFSERTRLYSEIEFEHSVTKGGDSSSGEVAMEQAYIEHGLTDAGNANLRAGLMLLPIGFLNEYHEPPVFYGVERNEVETRIIPTTWREIGFALQGRLVSGLEYNTGFTTTPDASLYKDASSGFRDMRTKANRVTANEFGYFVGLNYRGIPGVQVGGSLWSGNTAQDGQGKGPNASALTGVNATLTIWELHARYAVGGWDLRVLYTQGSLDDTAAINAAAGLPAGSNDAAPEALYGWYTEAAYLFSLKGDMKIAPFARYAQYNTQESVAAGFTIDPLNDEQVTTVGLNFYVHPQVVFKVDVQDYQTDDTKDRWDVGIG